MKARGFSIVTALITASVGLAGCADGEAGTADTYPNKNINFVTAGGPGGGLDLFAREIQRGLGSEDLLDVEMNITNMDGGGGNVAMNEARSQAGSDTTLLGNSNRVYLNPIVGTSDLTAGEDFVPISQLMTEYIVLAVRSDSKYTSGTEFLDALAENPRAASIGVGTVPSNDQLHVLRAADEHGVDPSDLNIVAFSSGGDLLTQLLGGQVDAISTGLSEALPQYEAGEIEILAITAPERLDGTAGQIPTWIEQGVDLELAHWRGVFGPADMPEEAVKFWEETFADLVETEAWKESLERNQWSPLYSDSDSFSQTLEEEAAISKELLAEVGMAQ